MHDRRLDRWTAPAALALAWLVPVTLAATQSKVRASTGGGSSITWAEAFLFQLPLWSPLLIVAPFAFKIARRLSLDDSPRLRRFALLAALGLGLAVVYLFTSAAVSVAVEGRQVSLATVLSAAGALLVRTFHLNLFIVAALMAAAYARENYLRVQSETLNASHLRRQLSEARLSTLKAQLRPHFLFNVLHSISSLIDEDKHAAREMIAALSDLLRHTLGSLDGEETELSKELESVDLYLAIEKIRFEDRLRLESSVASEALRARVPTLLLQPLVENAVVHGVEAHKGPGTVSIRARKEDRELVLEIENRPGRLRTAANGGPNGLGLGNTRARLERLYPERASIDLVENQDAVTTVVRLPFATATDRREETL